MQRPGEMGEEAAAHGESTRAGLELSEISRRHQPRLTAQKGLLWDAEVLASIHASGIHSRVPEEAPC